MPPKRGKKSHTKGGPKYVANADEIEHRNKALNEPEQRRGFFDDDGDDLPEFDPKIEDDKPKAPVFKTANPNAGGERNIKIKDLGSLAAAEDAAPRLSRKEREEKEAEEKKAAYQKLHKEGKTEEYAKDMERLKEAKEVSARIFSNSFKRLETSSPHGSQLSFLCLPPPSQRREKNAAKKKEIEEANAAAEAAMRAVSVFLLSSLAPPSVDSMPATRLMQ